VVPREFLSSLKKFKDGSFFVEENIGSGAISRDLGKLTEFNSYKERLLTIAGFNENGNTKIKTRI
jgi:hypothetical protein